jgi:DNA-binding SARP family transcriptional activator/DNA-binding beta-propeller fold protein YncE
MRSPAHVPVTAGNAPVREGCGDARLAPGGGGVRFAILGPLEIRDDDDRPVSLGTGRQRMLLAILLLRLNEVVSTDRLIDGLWGETPPETAAKALQGYVSQLRKALAPGRAAADGILVTRPPGYLIRADPEVLDAHRFERLLGEGRRALEAGEPKEAAATLRQALALWRGGALSEFAYEAFAQDAIARLEELRLTAIEERIEADLALGHHVGLAGELEALVGRQPLRERLRGQHMLALYRSGRQAEALQEYQRARRLLVQELGLEPGAALQRLERAILAQDPSLDAPVSEPEGAGAHRRTSRVAADAVVCIDPERGAIAGHAQVGRRPVALAVGYGSVWVANADDGTVSRLDPETLEVVRTIGIGATVVGLAVGPDAVWAANGSDGTVSRIDPSTDAVIETIDLRGSSDLVWNTTYAVAFDGHAVWVPTGPHDLVRIDPATSEPEAPIDVGGVPVAVAVVDGALWVATTAERALRIEPRTRAITAEVPVGYPVAMAAGEGAVWVADARGSVWCIEPDTAAVAQTIRVGRGPLGIVARDGALWAADTGAGTVLRVDLSSGAVVDVFALGQSPTDVAVGYGAVWVAVQQGGMG